MTDMPEMNITEPLRQSAPLERRAYHKPQLVNLGEIHALVMSLTCGTGDLSCAEAAAS